MSRVDGTDEAAYVSDGTGIKKSIEAFKLSLQTGIDIRLEEMPAFTPWDIQTLRIENRSYLWWAICTGNIHNTEIFAPSASPENNPFIIFLSDKYSEDTPKNVGAMAKTLLAHVGNKSLRPAIQSLKDRLVSLSKVKAKKNDGFLRLKLIALILALITNQVKETERTVCSARVMRK